MSAEHQRARPVLMRALVAANFFVLAAIGLVVVLTARASDWQPIELVLLLGAMTLLSEYVSSRSDVEGAMNISGSDVYIVSTAALLGPAPAVGFIVAAELGRFALDRRRPLGPQKLLNNATALAAYALLAGLLIRWVSGSLELRLNDPGFLVLVVVTTLVANVVCVLVINTFWHVGFGESFAEGMKTFWRFAPSHVIAGLLAAVGIYSYAEAGFTPFLILMAAFFASELMLGRLTRVEIALRKEHDRAQRYLDIVGTMVVVLDVDRRVELANRQACRTLGYSEEELLGRRWDDLVPGAAAALLAVGESTETVVRTRDGDERIVVWKTSEFRNEGEVSAILVAGDDVTARRRAEQEVAFLAFHDRLTRLPNRMMLDEHLETTLARARHSDERVAMLYVDLDNFKLVNDTLGHAAGDEILRQAAVRLREATRETDLVVRHGGDEFAVFLPQLSAQARQRADEVAKRIGASLARPFAFGDAKVQIGGSVGIALFPDDADDADALLRAADAAMYAAKRAGRAEFRSARVA